MTEVKFDKTVFNDNFFRLLKTITILSQRAFLTAGESRKRGRQKGGAVEFSDFRRYSAGDEFRHIDWNIFSRTEKFFVKEFAKDEEITVYILIDVSDSMRFGTPNSKLIYAMYSAAVISYISLLNNNKVQISLIGERLLASSPFFASSPDFFNCLSFLSTTFSYSDTTTMLKDCLTAFSSTNRSRGILFVISDMLSEDDPAIPMLNLIHKGFDLQILHLLSNEDISPDINGRVILKDSETKKTIDITVTETELEEYHRLLNEFCERWKAFCIKHGINYYFGSTLSSLDKYILNFLTASPLLK